MALDMSVGNVGVILRLTEFTFQDSGRTVEPHGKKAKWSRMGLSKAGLWPWVQSSRRPEKAYEGGLDPTTARLWRKRSQESLPSSHS